VRVAGSEHDLPDRFQIIVDPDAEPGDVLGALARLLISIPQDGDSDEHASRQSLNGLMREPAEMEAGDCDFGAAGPEPAAG